MHRCQPPPECRYSGAHSRLSSDFPGPGPCLHVALILRPYPHYPFRRFTTALVFCLFLVLHLPFIFFSLSFCLGLRGRTCPAFSPSTPRWQVVPHRHHPSFLPDPIKATVAILTRQVSDTEPVPTLLQLSDTPLPAHVEAQRRRTPTLTPTYYLSPIISI